MRRIKVLSLVCALLLTLTACGGGGLTAEDAANCVRGFLDKTYLGECSAEYLALLDLTAEKARADYEAGLAVEYQYFSAAFQFDEEYVTSEVRQEAIDLLAEIYRHARYEVRPAAAADDGYTVEVVVEPIRLIPHVAETYMTAYASAFAQKHADTTQADVEAMPADTREAFWLAYENDWAGGVVELFQSHLEELSYGEPVTLVLPFRTDENGAYTIPQADFEVLDAHILLYGDK